MLLTTNGSTDLLNIGKDSLQKWQRIYVENYKLRKYETEKRLAEKMIRRHCSIILKNKVETPTLRFSKQSSMVEIDNIKERMGIAEDIESDSFIEDEEAGWAEEVL